MSLEETQLDDFVSAKIMERFIKDFLDGFYQLMLDLGFPASLPLNK